jgi:hypothetical protein
MHTVPGERSVRQVPRAHLGRSNHQRAPYRSANSPWSRGRAGKHKDVVAHPRKHKNVVKDVHRVVRSGSVGSVHVRRADGVAAVHADTNKPTLRDAHGAGHQKGSSGKLQKVGPSSPRVWFKISRRHQSVAHAKVWANGSLARSLARLHARSTKRALCVWLKSNRGPPLP